MPDTLSQSLQTWQNFYLLMGGASATLVGLMFVAIWLGSNFFTEQTVVGLRTFVSPTLMHFVYVLITSAVVVIPTVTRTFLSVLLLLTGVISLGISFSGVPYMHHQYRTRETDMTDWVWYFLIPSASYLLYVVTGVALLKGASQALNALAGASILLLVVGIRNAWDLVVWFVLRKRSTPRRSDPSKRGASGRTG
ncbi:MAG: hypothetical protein AUH31_08000 [Armatimonadetes bacterium 13_1_40CM_64_14]|nr:MAG: hypothetical protein AUH31_08000 [Armatimonadetes bacterium 13_1_40CM_64_14]